jgi:hypothetical protein
MSIVSAKHILLVSSVSVSRSVSLFLSLSVSVSLILSFSSPSPTSSPSPCPSLILLFSSLCHLYNLRPPPQGVMSTSDAAIRQRVREQCTAGSIEMYLQLAKKKRQQANQEGNRAETFQITDEEVNEIRQRKALSHAMRKRVAEMHLQPPRFAPLKGQMYPLKANEIADDSEQRQSRVDAFQLKPKKKVVRHVYKTRLFGSASKAKRVVEIRAENSKEDSHTTLQQTNFLDLDESLQAAPHGVAV